MRYILSCCSTADLSREHFQNRDIHYICFHYEMNGVQYADDLGASMPFDQFYQAMADGADTKTSQVNVDEFVAYFTAFLEQGLDIMHVCLSSGISGGRKLCQRSQRAVGGPVSGSEDYGAGFAGCVFGLWAVYG